MREAVQMPAVATNDGPQARGQDAPSQLDVLLRRRFESRESPPQRDSICMHWPLDGATKIHAASLSLTVMAGLWAGAHAHSRAWSHILPRCIDVEQASTQAEADLLRLRVAAMSAEIQRVALGTRALAQDFLKIGEWLAGAAGSAWDATQAARHTLGLASTLGDNHRLIAKDRLAADMNALIAWLLRQALKLLDRMDLNPDAIAADLVGIRSYGEFLQSAAEMLDRAAALANESELFVEDFDQRWHNFRDRIAAAVALSKDALSAGGKEQAS